MRCSKYSIDCASQHGTSSTDLSTRIDYTEYQIRLSYVIVSRVSRQTSLSSKRHATRLMQCGCITCIVSIRISSVHHVSRQGRRQRHGWSHLGWQAGTALDARAQLLTHCVRACMRHYSLGDTADGGFLCTSTKCKGTRALSGNCLWSLQSWCFIFASDGRSFVSPSLLSCCMHNYCITHAPKLPPLRTARMSLTQPVRRNS